MIASQIACGVVLMYTRYTWVPTLVVVAAAFTGTAHVGALISLYLLAQRSFWGFDGVVDLSLATQSVRGAVNRCFEYIDSTDREPHLPAVA